MADTSIRDTLKDVLAHTHSLGIFEIARIQGTDAETLIETVDADRTVIMKGRLLSPASEFTNSVVGLSRMQVLSGYLNYPEFNEDGAQVSLITQERDGGNVPHEVEFRSVINNTANYRFMPPAVLEQAMSEIHFKGAEFDINVVPTQKNIQDLTYFNSVLGSYEANFVPKTEDGKLFFYIGDNGGDRTRILIADGIEGEMTHEFRWPLAIVLKILKLGDDNNVVLSLNPKGLLQIKVHSGLGEYTYLFPTKR